mmetsp:Transcript_9512/g.30063  ORF Transcript_9512/g.30063 Transcript_9512/m.30063 type:complete len:348 (+) Transcript_9512:523-1566(+)
MDRSGSRALRRWACRPSAARARCISSRSTRSTGAATTMPRASCACRAARSPRIAASTSMRSCPRRAGAPQPRSMRRTRTRWATAARIGCARGLRAAPRRSRPSVRPRATRALRARSRTLLATRAAPLTTRATPRWRACSPRCSASCARTTDAPFKGHYVSAVGKRSASTDVKPCMCVREPPPPRLIPTGPISPFAKKPPSGTAPSAPAPAPRSASAAWMHSESWFDTPNNRCPRPLHEKSTPPHGARASAAAAGENCRSRRYRWSCVSRSCCAEARLRIWNCRRVPTCSSPSPTPIRMAPCCVTPRMIRTSESRPSAAASSSRAPRPQRSACSISLRSSSEAPSTTS